MKHTEILLEGRVQGIGLRRTIKKFANDNNLKGSVKNNFDGSVGIIVQADKRQLEDFLSWLKSSPRFSKVKNIRQKEISSEQNYKEFTIKKKDSFLLDQIKSFSHLFGFGNKKTLKVPKHIAIIPDGNRRWAKRRGLISTAGHKKAASYKNVFSLSNEAKKLGIEYISFWGFSTENWKRDKKEVDIIFKILDNALDEFEEEFLEKKIRFRHFGRKDRISKKLLVKIKKLEEKTKNFKEFNVQLCLDYGGRDELLRTMNKLLKGKKKKIDEQTFSNSLDSQGVPDPDLIIRTSGEQRLSGLMPFQAIYAELYFTKKNFPDFDKKELRKAVKEFGRRKRRFGGN